MGIYGTLIADSANVGLRYAKRLFVGIPENRFARFAAPGGEVVSANHPAFIVGHLSLYPVKVVELLGQDSRSSTPSPEWIRLFSKDAKCVDDPQESIYPAMNEVTEFFFRSYDAALAAMRLADDALLSSDNPVDTPLKQVCPLLGSMLTFYLIGHVNSHLGQLSTWRRMEGLPAA